MLPRTHSSRLHDTVNAALGHPISVPAVWQGSSGALSSNFVVISVWPGNLSLIHETFLHAAL